MGIAREIDWVQYNALVKEMTSGNMLRLDERDGKIDEAYSELHKVRKINKSELRLHFIQNKFLNEKNLDILVMPGTSKWCPSIVGLNTDRKIADNMSRGVGTGGGGGSDSNYDWIVARPYNLNDGPDIGVLLKRK